MHLSVLLLTYVFFLIHFHSTAAVRRDFFFPALSKGRIFAWDNSSALSGSLNSIPEVTSSSKVLLNYVEEAQRVIHKTIESKERNRTIKPCNSISAAWKIAAANYFGLNGWPDPALDCITDIHDDIFEKGALPKFSIKKIYDAILHRGAYMRRNAKGIAKNLGTDWTAPDIIFNSEYRTTSQKCVLHTAVFIFMEERWHIVNHITNENKIRQLPDFARIGIEEVAALDGVQFRAALNVQLDKHPSEPPSENTIDIERSQDLGSSRISYFRGSSTTFGIKRFFPEENLAIIDALEKSNIFIQQAEDALTPSSIAILVLPLGLNLVPIALLAEVSTLTALLYTLMSDVLTVIPLGIKGLELMSIGRQRLRSVVMRISSTLDVNKKDTAAAAADLWTAECRSKDKILPIGVLFLVLSIVFLVGGVIAEFVARNYVKRRRKRRIAELMNQPNSSQTSNGSRSTALSGGSRTRGADNENLDIDSYDGIAEVDTGENKYA